MTTIRGLPYLSTPKACAKCGTRGQALTSASIRSTMRGAVDANLCAGCLGDATRHGALKNSTHVAELGYVLPTKR